jgi:hypothetical protein
VAAVGFGALFLLSGVTIHFVFAQATVHVDNSSPQDVRLELEGRPWLTPQRGTSSKTSLRRGRYQVTVRALTGEVLDQQVIDVDGAGNFVLNVLGAQTYTRGTVYFTNASGPGQPDTATPENRKWFRAEADYLFEPPPPQITVSSRRGAVNTVSKTYLVRGGPPPGIQLQGQP